MSFITATYVAVSSSVVVTWRGEEISHISTTFLLWRHSTKCLDSCSSTLSDCSQFSPQTVKNKRNCFKTDQDYYFEGIMPSGMCTAKVRHLLQSLCEIVVMEEYFPTSIQQLITVVEKSIFEYLGCFCQILHLPVSNVSDTFKLYNWISLQ